jgi:ABC-type phosphate/phosphonate transport system substrate-binding protein
LEQRLDEPIPAAELATIVVAIAAALEALHGADIVHGALRPSSILYTEQGTLIIGDYSRLQRFGERSSYRSAELDRLALDGLPADPVCDVALLGLVLHRILTGRSSEVIDDGPPTAAQITAAAWQRRWIRGADYRFYEELAQIVASALSPRIAAATTTLHGTIGTVARAIVLAVARWEARRGMVGRMARATLGLTALSLVLLFGSALIWGRGQVELSARRRQLEPGSAANPLTMLLVAPSSERADRVAFEQRVAELETMMSSFNNKEFAHVRAVVARDYPQAAALARACDLAFLPFDCYAELADTVEPALIHERKGAVYYYCQVVARRDAVARMLAAYQASGDPVPVLPLNSSTDLVRLLRSWIDRSHADEHLRWSYSGTSSSAGFVVFERAVRRELDATRLPADESSSYGASMRALLTGEADLATFFANAGQGSGNIALLVDGLLGGDQERWANLRQLAVLADHPIPNDVITFRRDFDQLARKRIEQLFLNLNLDDRNPLRKAIFELFHINGLRRFEEQDRARSTHWMQWSRGR